MPPELKDIEAQALQLPAQEREFLTERLCRSLDDEPLNEVDETWVRETEERYKQLKKGEVKGIPAEQALAEIRQELGWQS